MDPGHIASGRDNRCKIIQFAMHGELNPIFVDEPPAVAIRFEVILVANLSYPLAVFALWIEHVEGLKHGDTAAC